MNLEYAIDSLADQADGCDPYHIVALIRNREHPVGHPESYDQVAVYDVTVDENDSEINLLLRLPELDSVECHAPDMQLDHFLTTLRSLQPQANDYTLYTGTWMRGEGEYGSRLDVPVVGLAFNDTTHQVAFVQWYEGIEEDYDFGD